MMTGQDFDKMPLFTPKDFDRYRADIHRVYVWGLVVMGCAGLGIGWIAASVLAWWMR